MKTKRLSDILTRLIDVTTARTSQLTDYTPGSVIRSIYEAVAMELETYYVLQEENITWGIEHGVLDSFGFTRREAKSAYGEVTIGFYSATSAGTVLPKGMTFYSSDDQYPQTYTLQQAYSVPTGSATATVQVFCTQVGSIGNIPAGKIDSVSNSSTGVAYVTNPADFNTGSDAESLAGIRNRFQSFVDTRGRATLKAMDYAARRVEEVTGVYVYEEVGKITVYAHDANGELPADVLNAVVASEESYRPAGIPWEVKPVDKKKVDLELAVTVTNAALIPDDFEDKLVQMLTSYLNTFSADRDLILSDVVTRVTSYSPLIYDVSVTTPDDNVQIKPNEIIRAGDIAVVITNEAD